MKTQHTPGPWRFELNEKSKCVQLCGGNPKYDLTVMDFVRYGMNRSAPRFREDVDRMNIMHRCEKWAVPEIGREHHKGWFQRINHSDARLIEAAPDLLAAARLVCGGPERATGGRLVLERHLEILEKAIAKAEGSNEEA